MELLSSTEPARPAALLGESSAVARRGDGERRPAGAVLVLDDERCCREASLSACRLLGASRAAVEGRRLDDFFDPTMRARIAHFWEGFAEAGGTAGPFSLAGAGPSADVSLTVTANVVPGRHVLGIRAATERGERALEHAPGVRVPSARERQILALLAEGETDAQIAARLGLAPATVQTHVRNAKAKLGARTRAQAVALALSRSLIAA